MLRWILLAIFALALTGCATPNSDLYQSMSPQTIYAYGHNDLTSGDYTDAIAAFQALDSQYPFNAYTKQGDLELIYTYFLDQEPTLALAAVEHYLQLYPTSQHLDYVYYIAGVIDFNGSRGFLQRYFPYTMSAHDPADLVNAFNSFKQVVVRFPHSPYAPDARRRMIYLMNMIAQHQLSIADFYYNQGAYVAAFNRAAYVVVHYPRAISAIQAIKMMQQCYVKLGITQLAKSTASIVAANQAGPHKDLVAAKTHNTDKTQSHNAIKNK